MNCDANVRHMTICCIPYVACSGVFSLKKSKISFFFPYIHTTIKNTIIYIFKLNEYLIDLSSLRFYHLESTHYIVVYYLLKVSLLTAQTRALFKYSSSIRLSKFTLTSFNKKINFHRLRSQLVKPTQTSINIR